MTRIGNALVELNPWWKGEFHVEYKDREIHREIQRVLPLRPMVALTGLRRTGKTTLLLKAAEDAVRQGTNPLDVVYFSFDEFRTWEIRDIVRASEELTGRRLGERRSLVLLDEIQKVPGWEDQLKALYDRWGPRVKVLLSGSESLFIRQRSRESLAGRLLEFAVEPLSFREYLGFTETTYEPVGLYDRELARAFPKYLRTLGFPELVGVEDPVVVRKYVRESIVEKILYRDLPGLLRIRNVAALESLSNILMEEPGQLLDLSDLAAELGVSRQTASQYLSFLQKSFLLRKLYNYSPNRRKAERKLKKYYPTVISPELVFRNDELARARVLEWTVVTRLRAEFFWRDPYKNEVDAVLGDGKPVPVEVKSGRIETGGLLAFLRKFHGDVGYVVSSREEGERRVDGKRIVIVPGHKFLLRDEKGGSPGD